MIIDIHCHVGLDPVFGFEQTLEEVLSNMKKWDIDKTFISPFPIMDFKKANDIISIAVRENKNKLVGFMCVNPVSKEAKLEIDRALNELKLKGLMLDVEAYSVGLHHEFNRIYEIIEMASLEKIPILINSPDVWTGGTDGLSLKRRSGLDELLSRCPEATVIVGQNWPGSIELSKKHGGLLIETGGYSGLRAVREIGASRVLFSSNAPRFHPQIALEYVKYTAYSPNQKEMILGRNTERIFNHLL